MIKFKENKNLVLAIFISIIIFLSLLRLYIGSNLQLWFVTTAQCDDLLMLDYSILTDHFTHWNYNSLVKDMSYSIFLAFVKFSTIPYSVWLSVLWIISALLVAYAIYKFLTKNKIAILLSFVFILFAPIGFDIATGLRIYRHAIMPPATLICLTSLFIFLNYTFKGFNWTTVIWGIFSGLAFSFNYYIKEDGVMFLPILIITVLCVIIVNLYKSNKKTILDNVKIIAVCLLPLIIFAGTTVAYEQVNNHYFGISKINTRTDGELGEFYHILLKIDDKNKTSEILVPPSTIEKAFNASPTLKSHPELFNQWMKTPWAGGDLYTNNLAGDIIAWSLRISLSQAGLFNSEIEADNFFKQVNTELNQALDNGTLQKSDKIFITDSLNGKDINEIYSLKTAIINGLNINLFYEYVRATQKPVDNGVDISSQLVSNDRVNFAESIVNEEIPTNNELTNTEKSAIHFAELDIFAYHYSSYIIVLLTVLGFFALFISQIKNRFKDRQLNLLLLYEIMLLGTFLVQIFAIAWFTSWINQPTIDRMEYYTSGCQAIFALFETLAIIGGFVVFQKRRGSLS